MYQNYELDFMKSNRPCPAINVTEAGKFKRDFFYLDSLDKFLVPGTYNLKWGTVIFSEKYPNTHR